MATLAQDGASRLLRVFAEALHRLADRMERPAMFPLALEPLKPAEDADERIHARRHQLFTRYY